MKREKGYWVPARNDLNIPLILIIFVIKILCRIRIKILRYQSLM